MTVTNTNNKVQYSSDGVLLTYAYTFKIFNATDLVVSIFIDDVDTIVTNYTVTGVGATGGTIIFDTAPEDTAVITILRTIPVTQTTDYVEGDKFPANAHENTVDRLTMIDQQQDQDLKQSLKYPNSDPFIGNTLPLQSVRADKVMGFDSTGAPTVSELDMADLDTLDGKAAEAEASAAAALVSQNAAAASAGASASSASDSLSSANDSAASAIDSASSAAEALASETAVVASGTQQIGLIQDAGDAELVDIAAEGDTQIGLVTDEGDTQVARVISEGDTQDARIVALGDSYSLTKSVRQTMLTGPDMTATSGTIETAATKTGDLRSTYHGLGMDMLTGSRGGMIIGKDKGIDSNYLQSSLLSEVKNFLNTDTTATEADGGALALRQFLADGVQIGTFTAFTSANLYAFQTTHKTILDGNEWHYNPVSGFAMCKYHPDPINTAMKLQHPMGKAPLFIAIKDLDGVRDWTTGRFGTEGYMTLNLTLAEVEGSTTVHFTEAPTDTYIGLGTSSRMTAANMFLFGWFGDPLDDLEVGMVGERGVTASLLYTGGSGSLVIETGITDTQMILYKKISTAGDWQILNKAAGWSLRTELNNTDAEVADNSFSVSGSEITFAGSGDDYLLLFVGGTADAPDNKLKSGTKVLRKVGTAATGHRVDLGAAFSGGDNGGMVFGRDVIAVATNSVFDTIRGATHRLRTNDVQADTVIAQSVTGFITTGVTMGSDTATNSTNINQYTAFNTTHKTTTGDGLNWEYNPLTGFAMCKYTGDSIAGRTLTHPMGKKLRMGWFKDLIVANTWLTYHDTLSATDAMVLDATGATSTSITYWNDIEPDTTTITLGTNARVNTDTDEYIFYGWFGDDLSDISSGLTGERGVSAFWQYTGGSGAMSVDTGIDNITRILWKASSSTGDWYFIDVEDGKSYSLNGTGVEAAATWISIEGSVVTYAGGTGTVEAIAFGSKADSGIDNDVILLSSVSNPTIVSMANGFDSMGNKDIVKKLTATQTLNVTGDAGQKFIYMKEDGLLYFSSYRPEYLRNYTAYSRNEHVYDIDESQMYNASGSAETGVFIGECQLDNDGNVYDIKTYANGDIWESDWFASQYNTTTYFDNPFGHLELVSSVQSFANGRTLEETYCEISGNVRGSITLHDLDWVALITYAKAGINSSTPELRLLTRRSF